jgi:cell wall-associated NlpC family hydrolase
MHWSAGYVGLTWQEVGDELCWGLVRKILWERVNIAVPSYEPAHGGRSDDMATIAGLLQGEPAHWPWGEIRFGDERELDVAVFSRGGIESHVGVVVGAGQMIHLARDYDARIESFAAGRWRTRLAGIYRHQSLIG